MTLTGNALILDNHYGGIKTTCDAKLSAGKWQHVAIVVDGSKAESFIDGKSQGAYLYVPHKAVPIPDLEKPDHREHEERGFKPMKPEQRRQNRFNVSVGSDQRIMTVPS